MVEPGRNIDFSVVPIKTYFAWSNWSKHRCFGCAGQNVSRLVELGRKINVLVAPIETYLAGGTWSKPRCFGRAGRNVSRWVELGRNIEVRARDDRNIPRSVELGPKPDNFVAPVETYLA